MKPVNPLTVETANDLEVVIIREFDAPRELLYRCHTEADLVRKWLLGPPGWTMPVCEVDARVGGKYRYVWRQDSGAEMGMGGVFKEVVRPERLVNTQLFDQDWTGGETVGTMTFSETNGKTRMHQVIVYSSKEARDGALQTGMTEGMQMGYQRLDELMETLKVIAAMTAPSERSTGRSIMAVGVGFIVVIMLSLGVDQVLHVLNVYPPWGEPMHDTRLNLLALSYRLVFNTFGSYLMARLAPSNPWKHVWIGAGIGFVLSMLGVVGALMNDLGALWYPILLAVSSIPTAWLGGMLFVRSQQKR